MSFFKQLSTLIIQCKKYLKHVDNNATHGDPRIRNRYAKLEQLIRIYEANKTNLKYNNNTKTPLLHEDALDVARSNYEILLAYVPSFLAKDFKSYFYLQEYKIACTSLIVFFTNSKNEADWPKMRHVINWYNSIQKEQEALDTKASIHQSFRDIKALGHFDSMGTKGIQQLQEEVGNIQTLLQKDPSLEAELTAEYATQLRSALLFLQDNSIDLSSLPNNRSTLPESTYSSTELVAIRCAQLGYLVRDFAESFDKKTKVIALTTFKKELRHCFDQHQPLCLDINEGILKEIGSYKNPSLRRLCKMIGTALNVFSDKTVLSQKYLAENSKENVGIEKGLPTILEFEQILKTSIEVEV